MVAEQAEDQATTQVQGRAQARALAALERLLAVPAVPLHEALDHAMRALADVLDADTIDAFLYDPATDALVASSSSDTPMGRREREVGLDRLPLHGGGRHVGVYRTGVPYITGHAEQDTDDLPGFARDLGARSALTVPLELAGRRRGVFGVMSARPDAYTAEDLHFLQVVARWVGTMAARAEATEEQTRGTLEVARREAAVRQAEEDRIRSEEERAQLLARERAARAQADQTRARLEAVVEQMPVGVFIAEAPSGRLILGNKQVEIAWGQPFIAAATIEEYSRYRGFHADGRPYAPEEWPLARAILAGEVVTDEEIDFLRGDDTRGVMRASAAPIRDPDGTIVAGVATFIDVTALRQLQRTREAFLRAAAHDLKTPLTAISATAQLARRAIGQLAAPETADLDRLLSRMEAAVARMVTLIDDLAEVARAQVGQEPTSRRQLTDLVALVRSAVAAQEAVAPGRIHIDTAASELHALVDTAQIERALTNLLTNAIKYSPRGEPIQVRIAAEDTPAGPVASIAVIDQGVGIPADDLPHVFEQFRRGSNVTGLFPGTGVGLATTRQIVEAHGGQISVESQEGQGSTFVIRLPLGDVSMST